MRSIPDLFPTGLARALYLSLAIAAMICFGVAANASAKCTQEDARKAETEAGSLATWPALFASYTHYQHCDDGAISEGYSNSVATLLASHWEQIDRLRELIRAHPKFQDFVLRHVDHTMTSNQGDAIKKNLRAKCPAEGRKLCKAILKRFSVLGSP